MKEEDRAFWKRAKAAKKAEAETSANGKNPPPKASAPKQKRKRKPPEPVPEPKEDFEWGHGQEARDEGIAQVLANTPEYWRLLFVTGFNFLVDRAEPFTLEEVRPLCGPPPNHRNAYSAMCNVVATRGLEEGLIEVVGYTRARRTTSHRCLLPIYCKVAT